MAHKFSKAAYDAKKAAKTDAKAKEAATPANVPQLRELVSSIMAALGLR